MKNTTSSIQEQVISNIKSLCKKVEFRKNSSQDYYRCFVEDNKSFDLTFIEDDKSIILTSNLENVTDSTNVFQEVFDNCEDELESTLLTNKQVCYFIVNYYRDHLQEDDEDRDTSSEKIVM